MGIPLYALHIKVCGQTRKYQHNELCSLKDYNIYRLASTAIQNNMLVSVGHMWVPVAVCIIIYQMLMINEKAIHPYSVMAVRMPINLLFHSNIIEFCKLITLLLWFLNETYISYVSLTIIILL